MWNFKKKNSLSPTEFKLKEHRRTNHRFLTCDQCGAVVRWKFLSEHIHNHHTPEEKKKYRCECQLDCPKDCKLHCNPPKGFFYQSKLQDHLNMHRGIKPYSCNMGCSNAAFANSANLSAHIRSFHKAKPKSQKIPKRQRYPVDAPHVLCQQCGKSIRNIKQRIREHYETHMDPKEEFKCSDCGKLFASQYKLKWHGYVTHEFVTCDQCGAVLRRGFLKGHIHNHHTPEEKKNYVCKCKPDCPKDCKLHCNPPKGFLFKQSMQDHLNMHQGIKPYTCNMGCSNAAFAYKGSLSVHIRTFHKGIHRKKK